MMLSKGHREHPERRGGVYVRFERAILSLTVRVVAVIVERKLLKAIKRIPEPAEQLRAGLRWA